MTVAVSWAIKADAVAPAPALSGATDREPSRQSNLTASPPICPRCDRSERLRGRSNLHTCPGFGATNRSAESCLHQRLIQRVAGASIASSVSWNVPW